MTYADNALARVLGRSRNRTGAAVPPSRQHYFVPAVDLRVGDQIRDRGQLHTIDEIQRDEQFGSLTVIMDDGGRLGGIPLTQQVTVWLPAECAHA